MVTPIQAFLQIFKQLDFFSVPFQPAISDNKVFYHKSYLGALTSIILMIVSTFYTIQQLMLWLNWQLIPKVTQQQTTYSEAELSINTKLSIIVSSIGYNSGQSPEGQNYGEPDDNWYQIDPFDPQNIVLLPLLYNFHDNWEDSSFGNVIQYYNNGTLNLSLQILNSDELQLFFINCDTQYLIEGQKCASQERVDLFFSQITNQLYIKILFTQISPDNFQEQTYQRNYGILIEEQFCMFETIYLKKTKYDMDFQFLFDQSTYLYFFSDANDQTQSSSQQYCSKQYMPQTYGVLWLVQEQNLVLIKMRYPKIGEVFASIGSILTFLFLIKYVIVAMNFNLLRDSSLDKIADYYFSDLANCQITKTWYGKISSITLKGKQIEQRSYNTFRSQLREHFGCKLNYFNLIYEVSRIQMILCSLQSKSKLLKSHLVGIPIQLKLDQDSKLYKISNLQEQTQKFQSLLIENQDEQVQLLKCEDANILSYQQKQFCLGEQNLVKEIQQSEYDFYDLNKIQFIKSHRFDGTEKL